MARYIDAELLESKYREGTDPQDPYSEIAYLLSEDIESIPTADVEPVDRWISIKYRLPEPNTWVMVYIKYPSPVLELERVIQKMSSIQKMFYDGKSFYCDFGAITHWQPLPEPPKGE